MFETYGTYIAYAGPEAVGKSTQAKMLVQALTKLGIDAILTKEPTCGEYGQKIRDSIIAGKRRDREQELKLFLLDRADHMSRTVIPMMLDGKTVVSDRCKYDTAAYQSTNIPELYQLFHLNNWLFPDPDLTIYIIADAKDIMLRLNARESRDAIEQSDFGEIDDIRVSLDKYERLFVTTLSERIRFNTSQESTICCLAKTIRHMSQDNRSKLPIRTVDEWRVWLTNNL